MAKTSKKLLILLGIALFILVIANVGDWVRPKPFVFKYVRPDYDYTYSEEYHRQKISERTQEIFEEELSSGKIVNFEVETLYSFYDDDPEYFLITFEYWKEFKVIIKGTGVSYETKYQHIIGYHFGDGEHYYCVDYTVSDFIKDMLSPWHYLGYEEAKKYYGNYHYGILQGGELLVIYESDDKYPIGIISDLKRFISYCEESFDTFVPTEEQKEGYNFINPMETKKEYNKEIKNDN